MTHCLTISQGGAVYMYGVESATFKGTTFDSNSAVSSIYFCAVKATLSFTIQLKSDGLFLGHITISRALPMSGLGRCTVPTNGHCAESSLPLTVAPFLQHKSTDTHSRTQPHLHSLTVSQIHFTHTTHRTLDDSTA